GWFGYVKQTNTDEGDEDLYELVDALYTNNPEARAEALRQRLVVEEVMGYSVASVLMSNWDGFHNNMFLYHNPPPIGRWECIPWDLDKTFGFTDSDPMFVEMPLTFPLDGMARHASRGPGLISHPFHMDEEFNAEYLRRVREGLDSLFSEERVNGLVQEIETLLLEDLELLEQRLGVEQSARRRQIQESYETMRTFLRLRHAYLRTQLPTSVDDWTLR
ncbi:MAG: CotH kinase family protein, partial [bacterium]